VDGVDGEEYDDTELRDEIATVASTADDVSARLDDVEARLDDLCDHDLLSTNLLGGRTPSQAVKAEPIGTRLVASL
jgi:hypothetical protein